MNAPGHVLVVGASAAGLSTAEALRRKGFGGRLTLIGAEPEPPYDRPPLSKQVLSGAWEPTRAQLRTKEVLDALDAEFLLGDPAAALDVERRSVSTASGTTVSADAVVVATGITARTLPGQSGLRGVHVVRTVADSLALRSALLKARRVVVVGDGVLGAETAATARLMGLEVCVVGPQPAPMTGQLGPFVAGHLAALHTGNGVGLRTGVLLDALLSQDGAVTGVRLSDGEEVAADVVVAAIGCSPCTDWLAGSGLDLDDGVVCDAHCRAAEGVWAVGDVARWHHQGLGRLLRLENRTNATEQALAVAGNILGEDRPYLPVPYFWSDQFDVRLQVFGVPSAENTVEVVEGDPAEGRFVVRYDGPRGPVGVLGWRMPKQARLHRAGLVDHYTQPLEPTAP
ncbi:NAD(P)/FAD-dependent oxidoreductase [Streptomyces minutiscleroticus]|uniref:Pyridine nucleotide-disulfide oxidoreductase n=1 Tax=Streptomyces minutiscleroticus TaxID=68238 RepID=A0A918NZF4_9ACTN|nr:FAD-dependent oxidoreductase [Streptomyces minutiscleroticus]GGY08553.1 pyridine nucleotide-disulfide oxidoreductase [Streptomyces minutiscleroticus]